ncbi:MAG: DNA repair protein RecO [Kiritimatiellae bacterium]|nr:DNA repair protein RecO [Kiritimatiellia bacterium]
MFEKTEALALRVSPFSKTSLVANWLTPHHGRIATVVKGARRPKSAFLGQIDLFYTCEILFYTRDRAGMHILKECAVLEPRSQFRSDWCAAGCASYFCDLLLRVTPVGAPQPALYALVQAALDHVHARGAAPTVVFWYELRLMAALGLAPRLAQCVGCRRPLETPAGQTGFASARGGALCARCAERDAADVVAMGPDVLAMLRKWLGAATPRAAANTRCDQRQLGEATRALGLFLQYHLDLAIHSRAIAFGLLKGATHETGSQEGTS